MERYHPILPPMHDDKGAGDMLDQVQGREFLTDGGEEEVANQREDTEWEGGRMMLGCCGDVGERGIQDHSWYQEDIIVVVVVVVRPKQGAKRVTKITN